MAKELNRTQPLKVEGPDTKRRATIYLSNKRIKDIKYIAYHDDTTQTDIIDAALSEYIKQWEQKNGTIPKK